MRNARLKRLVAQVTMLAMGSIALAAVSAELDALDPLVQPAVMLNAPTRAVLISVARAGNRLVAVGEAGVIVVSDDNGSTWRQAKVPVGVTLTSVTFVDGSHGWAVGHSGVILSSVDGGTSWQRQFDARLQTRSAQQRTSASDGPAAPSGTGDPLLDVYFRDRKAGFAVGAFGQMFCTVDGGGSWLSCGDRVGNQDGNHLYGIRPVGGILYIVGERGSIFASRDEGSSFAPVSSPYEGSLFGLGESSQGELVVYGLRGRVFSTSDRGRHWRELSVGADVGGVVGMVNLADGQIAVAAQDGSVFVGRPDAVTLRRTAARQAPISSMTGSADGRLVGVGPRGVVRIEWLGGQGKGSKS